MSKKFELYLILLFFFRTYTLAGKVDDLFDGMYSKDIYSGYLETGNPNHKLFYVFTPSQSETPEKDCPFMAPWWTRMQCTGKPFD